MKKRVLIIASVFLLIATLGGIVGFILVLRNRNETQDTRDNERTEPQIEETTFNLNSYRIKFEYESGRAKDAFWTYSDYTPVKEPDLLEMNEDDLVDKLYEKGAANLYYVGGEKDTIFQLYPGFYRKLYVTDKIPEYSIDDDPDYIESEVSCTQRNVEIQYKTAVAQKCTTRVVTQESENESNVTNCYLNTDQDLYIAYVQEGNISNSSYNLCSELEENGITNWSVDKIQKIQSAQDMGFELTAEYMGDDTWNYSIEGKLANPCVETSVSVNKSQDTDNEVKIVLETTPSDDPCIQVIEAYSLSDEFSAKPDVDIEFDVKKN